MKKSLLLLLPLLMGPVLAQGVEEVPLSDVWSSIPYSPFDYSENVIRLKQGPIFKQFVQNYENAYVEPALRTRDLPTPFTTSLRQELGYYEATQNQADTTNP
ncbi:hypothetical protein [Candidatus Cyanaurora vandensis]|uniref:hypothetical protein n=1 Tax=Candidatus Cyanaurora vandensis TaxID=2714958 RepID=UPI00257D3FF0|nr:hypothetical protein [Candidatus Cyanaurora vandensis]